MTFSIRTVAVWGCIASGVLLAAASARADIMGFGDFSGFSINQDDNASGPTISSNTIHLTNQASGESRSIFHNTPQDITQFVASFTYRATGTPVGGFGSAFVLQNSGNGPNTVARAVVSGVTTRFGYSDFFGTFNRSVAVSLEHGSLGAGSSSTARYSNGAVGGGSNSTTPLILLSGNPIDVTLTYNGTLLHESLVDTVTGDSFAISYPVDIPSIVNGSTAYVGITASTNNNTATNQFFSNLQFTSIPEPATLSLLAFASLAMLRRRRRASFVP